MRIDHTLQCVNTGRAAGHLLIGGNGAHAFVGMILILPSSLRSLRYHDYDWGRALSLYLLLAHEEYANGYKVNVTFITSNKVPILRGCRTKMRPVNDHAEERRTHRPRYRSTRAAGLAQGQSLFPADGVARRVAVVVIAAPCLDVMVGLQPHPLLEQGLCQEVLSRRRERMARRHVPASVWR